MSEEKQQPSEMEVEENVGASGGGVEPTAPVSSSAPQEATMETESEEAAAAATAGTSSSSSRVMASSGTVGSVSISLHPLVIMNVSEHWTRLRAQEGSEQLG